MIPIERLRQVSVIYSHAHCPDGLASAMILKDAFRMLGMSPRIEFLAHGTPEHLVASRNTADFSLWCDFAPAASEFPRQLSPRAIVLDHHVGAKDIVESFGEDGVYADAELEPGVSGAVLAFREVWDSVLTWWAATHGGVMDPPANISAVRDFAKCVGARDTWQTKDPRFRRGQYISKMLMSKPASYWLAEFPERGTHRLPYLTEQEIEMGRALFEAHEEAVRQAVEQLVSYSLDTLREMPNTGGKRTLYPITLAVFQEQATGFRLCSDVAEALRQKYDGLEAVVAGFSYAVDKPGAEPRLLYSLRGLNGFDVCVFAKANGGGGHKAAAGFSVPVDAPFDQGCGDPYEYVQSRLIDFLRGSK